MNKKKLREKILNWEDFCRLEEKLSIAQRTTDGMIKKVKKRRAELFKEVAGFIENLLEGKVIEGKKITFATSGYSKPWWIYAFNPKPNNVIGVVLGEKTDNDPRFHVVFCNLDNKKVIYNDRELA